MELLQQNEYDISYFDGHKSTLTHNAGYSQYKKWAHNGTNNFAERANKLFEKYGLTGKKVLVIGCAKGYLVEELRLLGVDAFGIDWSQYAYDEAAPTIQKYLTVNDVKTYLLSYKDNEFSLVTSANSLCCFSDLELISLVKQLNRISIDQFHLISEAANPKYYNARRVPEWILDFDWDRGITITNINGEFEVK